MFFCSFFLVLCDRNSLLLYSDLIRALFFSFFGLLRWVKKIKKNEYNLSRKPIKHHKRSVGDLLKKIMKPRLHMFLIFNFAPLDLFLFWGVVNQVFFVYGIVLDSTRFLNWRCSSISSVLRSRGWSFWRLWDLILAELFLILNPFFFFKCLRKTSIYRSLGVGERYMAEFDCWHMSQPDWSAYIIPYTS